MVGAYPTTLLSAASRRSEEHTSELQSRLHLVCRLLLEQKTATKQIPTPYCQPAHAANNHLFLHTAAIPAYSHTLIFAITVSDWNAISCDRHMYLTLDA